MANAVTKYEGMAELVLGELLESDLPSPEDVAIFWDAIRSLPEDALDIVLMIFQDPDKWVCNSPRASVKRLSRYTAFKFGWDNRRIKTGMENIRAMLKELRHDSETPA